VAHARQLNFIDAIKVGLDLLKILALLTSRKTIKTVLEVHHVQLTKSR
jgi:hypothetical protein